MARQGNALCRTRVYFGTLFQRCSGTEMPVAVGKTVGRMEVLSQLHSPAGDKQPSHLPGFPTVLHWHIGFHLGWFHSCCCKSETRCSASLQQEMAKLAFTKHLMCVQHETAALRWIALLAELLELFSELC